MTWPTTPCGAVLLPEAGVVELVGPARVVEEVRGRQRDVDVAALLDRLAVVDALEDGELAGALLQEAGDAEQVLAAVGAGHPAPEPLKARRAAATARSTSASLASVTSARTSSVAGLSDLKADPPCESANSPLMNSP